MFFGMRKYGRRVIHRIKEFFKLGLQDGNRDKSRECFDSRRGDKTIVVNETATNEIANCICPYDLTMEVGELVDNNAYTIKIVHQGTTLLEENVTYTKDLQGKKTIRQAMRYDE